MKSSAHSPTFPSRHSSFSNPSVASPTSQLILQPFRRFTYVTAHSPTLPLLHLRHSSFSNPSFASPTSLALHLRHLASRPCPIVLTRLGGSCFKPYTSRKCIGYSRESNPGLLGWQSDVLTTIPKRRSLYIVIVRVFCPRADASLHAQEPRLQFCRRQVFHRKLKNQGCSFTRD